MTDDDIGAGLAKPGAPAAAVREIISRDEALRRGLNKFFTGKPCKRGHVAERFVSGIRWCVVCAAENRKHKCDTSKAT